MTSRSVVLVASSVLALTGVATVTSQAGHASPAGTTYRVTRGTADSAPAKAPGLPTTDRYAVRLVAKVAADAGHIMVSSNGKWAVTDTEETLGSTIQLISIDADKVVGTISKANDYPSWYPVGVDNAGIVYGTYDAGHGDAYHSDGFTWNGKTFNYIPLPGGLVAPCPAGQPSYESVNFESVNASGVAVGVGSWLCLQVSTDAFGGAILFSPTKGVEYNGSYHDSTDTVRYPEQAYEVDDAGIVSGYLFSTGPEVWWRVGVDAAPQTIATNVGEPAVYPSIDNSLWQNGDFVGGTETYATTPPQSLFHGNIGSETVTLIPDTSGDSDDLATFVPQAMDPKELVVGDWSGWVKTPTYQKVAGPALWSVGSSVTSLTSLLTSATKDHLLSAMATDDSGDIFGTATTSTAKNAPLYFYEAVVSHPAPTVKVTAPKSGKTYKKDVSLKASYTCKAGKGATLKSCKGTDPGHHKVSTAKVGKHTFTVTATDTDGEKTNRTVHFSVKK